MTLPALNGSAAPAVSWPAPPAMQPGQGPILHFRIQIGRPKKKCSGFGICLIKVEVEPAPPPVEERGTARATGWVEGGRLYLEFERNSIESTTLQTYFGSGTFRMEEDYTLPTEVASALGVSAYTIKAGSYPITASGPDSETLPVAF